jgi:O-antigen/teichoic acid export membrane protein
VIAQNASWKLAGLVVGGLLTFAFNVVLMRSAGPSAYGQWAFALGWAGLFSVLVEFGFNPLVVMDVSRDRTIGRSYLAAVLRSKTALAVAGGVLLTVFSLFNPLARETAPLIAFGYLLLISNSFFESGQSFIAAAERFKAGSLVSAAYKAAIAMAGIAIVLSAAAISTVMGAVSMIAFAGAAVSLWAVRRMYAPGEVKTDTRLLLQRALPLFVQNVFILIYFKIDTVMLGFLKGDFETGVYNAAYRFFEVSNAVPTAIVAAAGARLSRSIHEGNWTRFWKKLMAGLFGIACLCAAALAGTMGFFASDLLGEGYAASEPVVRVLSLTILFFFPNYLLTTTLVLLNRSSANAWVAGTAVLFNVAANFYAIPRWGAMGAACTTLVTEALITAGCGWIIWRSRSRPLPTSVEPPRRS